MKTLELVSRSLLQLLLARPYEAGGFASKTLLLGAVPSLRSALKSVCFFGGYACAATLCIRLCTGCTYLKALHEQSKPTVVFALKEAYANGGATAVSNKIEQLVIDGKVTPAQATQLHTLAQRLYDGVVQHLETTDLETALAPTNAPAIQ